MLKFAYSKLHDVSASEDLVQDTFTLAYEKFEELQTHPDPQKWLYGVMRNKIKHELRARARFASALGKLERELLTAHPVDGDHWRDILKGLTKDEFDLLKLIYVDGYHCREVADKLNITYDACRKRVQTAKDNLRNVFGKF